MRRLLNTILVCAALASQPAFAEPSPSALTFSETLRLGHDGQIKSIVVREDQQAVVTTRDGRIATIRVPLNQVWAIDLAKAGVDIEFPASPANAAGFSLAVLGLIAQLLGMILLMGVVIFVVRMGRNKFRTASFEKARPQIERTLFTHVAGADEGKQALMDVVAYLKDPQQFEAVGAKPRRGVLLTGDPGNGKTLLARAVAGEAGVPFMAVSGSAFQEMFAGIGAARVRAIFKQLRKAAPCILFIDEIDSIGKRRSDTSGSVENDSANTLNELLTQLDGLTTSAGIIVIGATNRIDVLDPALVRSGRFDMHITVPAPDQRAREAILSVSARDVEIGPDVDFAMLARGTPGFSGADLATLVNEAALRAGKRSDFQVRMADFEEARDAKLLGGDHRNGLMIDADEMATIIAHEAGHALANILQPECDPIHKGTVAARGRALGYIAALPIKDRILLRKSKLMAELVVIMAGRAAEELKFGPDAITSGAAADSQEATRIARDMVARFGMGSTMASRIDTASPFSARTISEHTKQKVDEEVEQLLQERYARALALLRDNQSALDALIARFNEVDTLSGDEMRAIVGQAGTGSNADLVVAA